MERHLKRNYNAVAAEGAEIAGEIISHDDLPPAPVGREGMDFGKAAQPSRPDLGDVGIGSGRPQYKGSDATEYQPPASTLPTSISAQQSADYSNRLCVSGDLDNLRKEAK